MTVFEQIAKAKSRRETFALIEDNCQGSVTGSRAQGLKTVKAFRETLESACVRYKLTLDAVDIKIMTAPGKEGSDKPEDGANIAFLFLRPDKALFGGFMLVFNSDKNTIIGFGEIEPSKI